MSILLDVDGTTTPIRDCVWIETAPCGCDCTVVVANMHTPIVTAEQAAGLDRTAAAARWHAERGFTWRIALRSNCSHLLSGCPHDPPYGGPRTPQGMAWMALRRGTVMHLVFGRGSVAECGMAGEWVDPVQDLPYCSRCERIAERRAS